MINKNWKELIKPRKIEFLKDKDNFTNAELVAEPLESGYGQTLGNMLRRVLLSSIRGAAVTSIKIEGITHEFSSIPGVIEDVTEIILNIKQLALRLNDVESTKIQINANVPKTPLKISKGLLLPQGFIFFSLIMDKVIIRLSKDLKKTNS